MKLMWLGEDSGICFEMSKVLMFRYASEKSSNSIFFYDLIFNDIRAEVKIELIVEEKELEVSFKELKLIINGHLSKLVTTFLQSEKTEFNLNLKSIIKQFDFGIKDVKIDVKISKI